MIHLDKNNLNSTQHSVHIYDKQLVMFTDPESTGKNKHQRRDVASGDISTEMRDSDDTLHQRYTTELSASTCSTDTSAAGAFSTESGSDVRL